VCLTTYHLWQDLCECSLLQGTQTQEVCLRAWQNELMHQLMPTKLQQEMLLRITYMLSVPCVACSVKSAEIALELDKQMAESDLLLGVAEKVRLWKGCD
jgi:hypothetical protein